MACPVLIALMGAGSYLRVRHKSGVRNQKKRVLLKTEVRKVCTSLTGHPHGPVTGLQYAEYKMEA